MPVRLRPSTRSTAEALRAEGVLEIGCVEGTSVLYVKTRVKVHVYHARKLPKRTFDDYAVRLAVNWIEIGFPSYEVAQNFDMSTPALQRALESAGYARLSPSLQEQKTHKRAVKRLGKRGKLVHVGAGAEV